MNKYRFVFVNGDVVTVTSDRTFDNEVLIAYVNRLKAKKPEKLCQSFSFDEKAGSFVPINKEIVTIALTCVPSR